MFSFLLAVFSVGGLSDCEYAWQRCYLAPQLFANFVAELTGPDMPYVHGYLDQSIITEFYYADGETCFTYPCDDAQESVFACGMPSMPHDFPYQCNSVYASEFYPIRYLDLDLDGDIDLLDYADLQTLSETLDAE